MSIKLTPHAYERLQVHRVHDSEAHDALARLLVRIDEDPLSGLLLADLLDPPPEVPSEVRRRFERIKAALRGVGLEPDARIDTVSLASPAPDPPLAVVVYYPRDLTGGPANATIISLGIVLRQRGSSLT